MKPVQSSSAPQDLDVPSPGGSSPAEGLGKPPLAATAQAEGQDKNSPAAAKIGGELESLEDTMKGPLDALVESEALEATGFDDPTADPQLQPAVRKKFKLRRFLKNLFRRDTSKVVRIQTADPRQVKLILISWGAAVVILIGLLTAFWAFSQPGAGEILQKAEEAVIEEDYTRAIAKYDEFLKHFPTASNADDVRLSRSLAELRRAEKEATAQGDWTPAFKVAEAQMKALPKGRTNSEVMDKVGLTLAKIGEGLAQRCKPIATNRRSIA